VRQQLIDLNEVQKIDLAIREVEKQREAVSKNLLELESSKNSLQKEITALTEQCSTWDKEVKVLEGNIQAETLKLKKWEVRLNEIRNQREYLALSREIEGSKRANREAEERITELNKQKQAAQATLEGLQDRLGVIGIDCDSERAVVERALADIDTHLTAEKHRREKLYPTIPKGLLAKYESVRAKRMGVGLALITDGRCGGCNIKLPPQLFNILQRVNTVEQCPSCLRIMLWDRILDQSIVGSDDQASETTSSRA
jgi:uncharacterized protein